MGSSARGTADRISTCALCGAGRRRAHILALAHERYLKAGADGIYVEAPESEKELEHIGRAFKGVPQMTNMFEGDSVTPWLSPRELKALGFSMILYPTTLLFRVVWALKRALANLHEGKPTPRDDMVDLQHYEEIVGLPRWAAIENRFGRHKDAESA